MKTMLLMVAAITTGCLLPLQPPDPPGPAPAPGTQPQPAPAPPAQAAAAPAPAPVSSSFSLHNDCPRTVKLFIGREPSFGSGTQTSISHNETQRFSLRPDQLLWIIDGGGNGLSSAGPGGPGGLRITESCQGFAPDRTR